MFSFLKGLFSIIGLAATLASPFIAYKAYQLSATIAELEANKFSFEAILMDSTLILAGRGGNFLEPTYLNIVPHFNTGSAILNEGHPITIPVSGGEIHVNEKTIVFNEILEAICEYPKNFSLCDAGTIAQLEVSLVVNGKPDTDIVIVPKV